MISKSRKKRALTIGFSIIVVFLLLTFLLTLPLRWINPAKTAFTINDENVDSLNLRDSWTRYADISPELFLAIISSEDQKFPEHAGFDFESLKKALMEKRSKRRGASTITQQLVKNIYLWPGRSIIRKGMEAWLTVWIEMFLNKKRILELYVNVVEFGTGIYGIGKATDVFFRANPRNISRRQAALLAAVLPSPKRFDLGHPSYYLVERAQDIQRSMQLLGGISYLSKIH